MRNHSPDAWEWYGETREIFQVCVNPVKTVTIRKGIRSGSALRIVKGHRTGTAFISGQDEPAIRACAERAEKNLSGSMETDALPSFSAGFDVPDERKYYDPAVDDPDRHAKMLQSDELWKHHRIEGVNLAEGIYQEERVIRFIITSNGANLRSDETLFTRSGKWFSTQHPKLMFEDHASSHYEKANRPSWQDTLSVLAERGSGCSMPPGFRENADLIFSPAAGRHWLSVLFHAFLNGFRITEPLTGPVSANDRLIVADDRTIRNAPGSTTFDGEGYPAQRLILFRNGITDQEIVHSEKAVKTGKNPTGHTERDEWLRPFTAPGNLFIQNGTLNYESLIRPVTLGIWVYQLFGVSGEDESKGISFGFEGRWIIDGQISAPCSGMTQAWPIRRWIEKITGIGNDLRMNQRVSSPTLKFSGINVTVC